MALDVHADQAVGVKGGTGQLFDFAGNGEHVCCVPEFWERLHMETPTRADERRVPGLAEFPQDVMDPGFQGAERAFVSLVEGFERNVRDGEEGRPIDNKEVVRARAAETQGEKATHDFSSVDGAVLVAEPGGESADGGEIQSLRSQLVL